jgi:glycosyltransferase involved in cell wall biosynthesis
VTTRPLVSIITPTFNQGAFIEATIRSIRGQTYTNFEHIVIDAGSTDETHEILRRYEGAYPMRWISEPDDGMYDAVNKGMRLASGDILCYLNSDDLYFPWTLETVVGWFQGHPGTDVVYGDAINIDHATRREHVRVMPAFSLARLVYVWPLPQPATFWRAAVGQGLGGFDAGLKYVGDWDFFIRAGRRFNIEKVDEFLAVERRHELTKTLGQAASMKVETERMLAGHQSSGLPDGPRRRLRLRAYIARRIAWLRLLRAFAWPAQEGPWARLVNASEPRFSVARLLAGFVPWSPQEWKAGSVRTGVDWLDPDA